MTNNNKTLRETLEEFQDNVTDLIRVVERRRDALDDIVTALEGVVNKLDSTIEVLLSEEAFDKD